MIYHDVIYRSFVTYRTRFSQVFSYIIQLREKGSRGSCVTLKYVTTAVTPTDRPKSVRNRCVIKVFGGVFMLSRCFWIFLWV